MSVKWGAYSHAACVLASLLCFFIFSEISHPSKMSGELTLFLLGAFFVLVSSAIFCAKRIEPTPRAIALVSMLFFLWLGLGGFSGLALHAITSKDPTLNWFALFLLSLACMPPLSIAYFSRLYLLKTKHHE